MIASPGVLMQFASHEMKIARHTLHAISVNTHTPVAKRAMSKTAAERVEHALSVAEIGGYINVERG